MLYSNITRFSDEKKCFSHILILVYTLQVILYSGVLICFQKYIYMYLSSNLLSYTTHMHNTCLKANVFTYFCSIITTCNHLYSYVSIFGQNESFIT